MIVDLHLSDEEIERIAIRLAQLLHVDQSTAHWLDVAGAAAHLGLTQNSIRGLLKRRKIPFHRMQNGRLRFSVTELDHWVRTGSCAETHEDLP